MGVGRKVRVLQAETAGEAECHTEQHGHEEREEEYADSVKEGREVDVLSVELG
jgi:hypothetical protein